LQALINIYFTPFQLLGEVAEAAEEETVEPNQYRLLRN
jgi:hypothetical protein